MTEPWSNQSVSLIVISSGGGFTGLFVYSPSPGANNLIESAGVPQTFTDPYGNGVFAGETTYKFVAGQGYWAKTNDGTSIIWRLNPTNQQLAGYTIQATIDIYLSAPSVYGLSFGGTEALLGPAGYWDDQYVTVDPATPGSPETLHSISSGFPAGWTGTIRYGLTGLVIAPFYIRVDLTLAAATAVTWNELITSSLPVAYQPSSAIRKIVAAYSPFGVNGDTPVVLRLGTSDIRQYNANFTTPAGGTSTIKCTWLYD